MRLHENKELFATAIAAASRPEGEGGLGINSIFIEKDYWICRSLKLMAEGDSGNRAIFKGGTSLTKAYGIGSRFSEDIDVAIANASELTGNQLKSLIKKTSMNMTIGLAEVDIPGQTSKGSKYRKEFFTYPSAIEATEIGVIKVGQLLVEINSFANPYPFKKRTLRCFLTDFFEMTGNGMLIEEYGLQPFSVNVLDKCRTLTEKLVSLVRFSLAGQYILELKTKIRHFYDIHHLLQDAECRDYLSKDMFKTEFNELLAHDRETFANPDGWQQRTISESPLVTDFHSTWQELRGTYIAELPLLAYREVPNADEIEQSISQLMALL